MTSPAVDHHHDQFDQHDQLDQHQDDGQHQDTGQDDGQDGERVEAGGGRVLALPTRAAGESVGEFSRDVLDDVVDAATGGRVRPVVEAGTGPDAVRRISAAITLGLLPEVYVSDGALTAVQRVSGTRPPAAGNEDVPLPVEATPVTPKLLASLLANHARVTRPDLDKQTRKPIEVEYMPGTDVLATILARLEWPHVPPLRGIIGAPVLRPDGTLLQDPGYDPGTGYYLAPAVDIGRVPDRPTREAVAAARAFLGGRFLRDFPWRGAADKANYVGLLATQILRPYTRALSPWVIVDATMPGSGKTILTSCLGMLYGQRVMTWTDSEEELRKTVTSLLTESSAGCIVFDNLEEGHVINSAVLARLVTERTWTDRRLGGNSLASAENNRLWMATGNNLRTGGDMASRTVWVRLDPDCPSPEARTGFGIPNLDTWILDGPNQAIVLRAVLTLVLDWTAAGAPRDFSVPAMRQFTTWAQTVGGFLGHHDIPGFLTNVNESKALDDDGAEWRAFLLTWHAQFAETELTAAQLRATAERDPGTPDPWEGTFLTDTGGRVPTVKSLGRLLTGQIGRWRGDIVLRSVTDPHGHGRRYWVTRTSRTDQTPKETAETAQTAEPTLDLH